MKKKVPNVAARTRLIAAPVSQLEEQVVLDAVRRAGYNNKGTAAREVLLAWALGFLDWTPGDRLPVALERDVVKPPAVRAEDFAPK